jgi:hypothetical protein
MRRFSGDTDTKLHIVFIWSLVSVWGYLSSPDVLNPGFRDGERPGLYHLNHVVSGTTAPTRATRKRRQHSWRDFHPDSGLWRDGLNQGVHQYKQGRTVIGFDDGYPFSEDNL